ncbi:RAMP superfamily CRISPR-associated protein, partial [Thermoflexus sp.]|uniref:RAMP superfamily CRISPR-associated protein n=1 Tax=Thermoflexus sp. TaxID=1969742 RepID=UPI002ADD3502
GMRTCAGQKGHCGRPTCPICYTFGSVSERGSFSGVVSICDARILLFPVYSMAGPVWVTSPSVLRDFGVSDQSVAEDRAKWGNGITTRAYLNLGWLMVARDSSSDFQIGLPPRIPDDIRNRVVLVSDKLFSIVVNSNLEVRTSVSINPETGAAEEGALFTYEAIPRATVLWMEVVVDDFRGQFPSTSPQSGGVSWTRPVDVVVAGLEWAEHLGIGGMGTRGFGRIRYLGEVEDGSASASNHQSGPAGHSTGSMDHGES